MSETAMAKKPVEPILEGTWRQDDIRHAFVSGVRWWEMDSQGATLYPSDQRKAEAEAERRYPHGKLARKPRGKER